MQQSIIKCAQHGKEIQFSCLNKYCQKPSAACASCLMQFHKGHIDDCHEIDKLIINIETANKSMRQFLVAIQQFQKNINAKLTMIEQVITQELQNHVTSTDFSRMGDSQRKRNTLNINYLNQMKLSEEVVNQELKKLGDIANGVQIMNDAHVNQITSVNFKFFKKAYTQPLNPQLLNTIKQSDYTSCEYQVTPILGDIKQPKCLLKLKIISFQHNFQVKFTDVKSFHFAGLEQKLIQHNVMVSNSTFNPEQHNKMIDFSIGSNDILEFTIDKLEYSVDIWNVNKKQHTSLNRLPLENMRIDIILSGCEVEILN